jgi:hypothetical protein
VGTTQKQHEDPGPAQAACAHALHAALAGAVLLPEDVGYVGAMNGLFSSAASLTRPLCIVQPRDSAQVATTLKTARDFGCPVTVRGGGCSVLCARDRAVMIDLAAHLCGGTLVGNDARMGGGATMGAVLDILAPQSRLIPMGVARIPGMGLALRGGVGYLTRSAGLTLDHLREVEIVVPSGEVLTLSEQSRGQEADLWWAVRGAAPSFGVATSVMFRSRPAPTRMFVQRLMYPLEALSAYFELAPALPRNTSASAILGPSPDASGVPVLFVYVVGAGDGTEGISRVQAMTRELTKRGGTPPLWERDEAFSYSDLPPFDVPALGDVRTPSGSPGQRWGESPPSPATKQRLFNFEKCPFLKALDATAAARLVEAIKAAPTRLCRIDLQHCGGALADVAPAATAFWNRDFEWNCPVIGAWHGLDGEQEACTNWVRETVQLLAPYTVGTYSVEVAPGLPETAREVEQAFGGNLPRLRELKRRWDPDNLLRLYYPLI